MSNKPKFTPPNITSLEPGEVFVFGSNSSGRHGAGAAKLAHLKFGAIYGQGIGPMGSSYAIPTKDATITTLPLTAIKDGIIDFCNYAGRNRDTIFYVTEIGCGLAGYKPSDIAPLFPHPLPPNIILPASFHGIHRRPLHEIRHDIWRQFPSWPSTFGPCHCDEGKRSRGGGICLDCAKAELAAIVGQPEADAYVTMVQTIRRKEREQDELAHEQSKQ